MSRSILYGLGLFEPFRSVHCYGKFTLGIRLGLFPLGLRTPCSFVPPVPRQCAVLGAGSGRLLFGGRKASFPQLGLLLVPSESALRTTPFLVFISVGCGVASASKLCDFVEGRRSSLAMDAHSGNSPRLDANACPKSARRRADFSHPCAHARLRRLPYDKIKEWQSVSLIKKSYGVKVDHAAQCVNRS